MTIRPGLLALTLLLALSGQAQAYSTPPPARSR